MVHCQKCGQINAAESNFCRGCGLRLAAAPPPMRPAPPMNPPPDSPIHQSQPPTLIMPQMQPVKTDYEHQPPGPYSWKTDEFQTNVEARKTMSDQLPQGSSNVSQMPNFGNAPHNSSLVYQQPHYVAPGYRCQFCGSNYLPIMERRISTAGWITFALLLVFTFIFFWIGLLIKEDVRICPNCRRRVD